jgi:hypothetical protein
MDWKKFLKPTKGKIIISIIFVLVFFILDYTLFGFGKPSFSPHKIENVESLVMIIYTLPTELILSPTVGYLIQGNPILGVIILVLSLASLGIYWYLISSSIVWIYSKIRKK